MRDLLLYFLFKHKNPTYIDLFTGAFQWEELEEDIRKKVKDSGDVSSVIEKVKCILKTPGKVNSFIENQFTLIFFEF